MKEILVPALFFGVITGKLPSRSILIFFVTHVDHLCFNRSAGACTAAAFLKVTYCLITVVDRKLTLLESVLQ